MHHAAASIRAGLVAIVVLLAASAPASAQVVYTWTGGSGTDANWSTAGNWTASSGSPPPASDLNNTSLILTGTTQLTNNLDYNLSFDSLFFDSSAGAFTINSATNNSLTVGLTGISVLNDNNQTINVNLVVGATNSTWGNAGSATLLVTGNVDASAHSLILNGSGNSVYSGVISGLNTTITKVDSGTVTFSGANTYTGVTAISGGVLSISADNNLGAAPASPTPGSIVLNGGTLGVTSSFTLDSNRGLAVGTGAASSAGTIDVASGQTLTYNGIIANNGANDQMLAKSGDGTLILGGASTFSGGTLIKAGTIRVDNASALGSAGTVSLQPSGGTSANLLVNVAGSFNRPVAVGVTNDTGTGTVTVGSSQGLSGAVTFGGTLQLMRPVTIVAGASDSTSFAGTISSSGSTPADITISSPTPATATSNRVIFTQNATANTYGNIIIGDAAGPHAVLQIGNGTASNNNIIPDTSNIIFSTAPAGSNGGSQLIFSPGNASTDGETVGALRSLSLGAGTITTSQLTSGGGTYTLTVGGGDQNGVFSGLITQGSAPGNATLAIAKTGTGTQILFGDNNYSGGTTVNGGRFLVLGQSAGGSGTGTGTVLVNSGGTLAGAGRVGGAVTVNGGGTIMGGDGSGGTLVLGNGLTLANAANISLQVFDSSTPSNTPGGSTVGSVPNPTSNNFIHITGGGIIADPTNLHILVDGGGNTFDPLLRYSYQVAQVVGQDVSGLSITNQAQFTPTGFADPNLFLFSVTGNNTGAIFLNIAPVPEPTMVFGLAAGALSLGGLLRRRIRQG